MFRWRVYRRRDGDYLYDNLRTATVARARTHARLHKRNNKPNDAALYRSQ